MKLLTRASLRGLTHHGMQLALSVLGVALGVAVVVAVDLAVESARTAFRVSTETVAGRATHRVVGRTGWIDEGVFTRLRTELGLRPSAPIVEGPVSSPALPGRALTLLGVDPLSEGPFRTWVADEGGGIDLGGFMTRPGAAVLARATAERASVTLGDTLPVLADGRVRDLLVVGVLEPGERLARAGLSDVVLVDVATAQELLGMEGRLTRIDLRVEGDGRAGADGARPELLERVAALLPPPARLEEAGRRSETTRAMIAAFDLNLTALGLLALVFGMFLIYNAMTFSVVQRRDLLGRLRTLGVTRREILRLVLREALWIGLAGAVLGAAGGALLGRGLVRLVTRTINDLYFAVSVEGVALDVRVLAGGALLGVVGTLAAALPPALEAARVPPRAAMLRSTGEERARRSVPRTAGLGALLLVAGAGLMTRPGLLLAFGGLFLAILGAALLTPLGTVLLVRLIRPPLARVGGLVGSMAARGVVTSLSRTAPAVAALVVAVSVTVGLGVMIQSFRGTLERWLETTLQADLYVSVPGPGASAPSGAIPPEVLDAVLAHPGIAGRNVYRHVDVDDGAGLHRLIALDLDPRGGAAFDFLEGDARTALARFRRGEAVLVSEPFANRRDVGVGDAVTLAGREGERRFPVAGVYRDYGAEQGTVMIARSAYTRLLRDPEVTSLALFLAPGSDPAAVAEDLLARLPEGVVLEVRSNGELRAASLEVFDRTFRITGVLRLLAFLVAFVGVLSALMALELERGREMGVLRAIGLTPGELRRLVFSQTGLLGLVSGVLALPLGLALATVMIFVINRRSFGWSLDMEVHGSVLLQAIGLALAGALLAGVVPARRMASASPAAALRGE